VIAARLDLADGVVLVHAGARGLTIELPARTFSLRDRRELDVLLLELFELRERLMEGGDA
jgi:hypothetical protein